VAPGIILVILGAILAFAVRTDASWVDLQTVGLIFMLAGVAIMAYARREKRTKAIETHVEQRLDADGEPHAVRQTVTHEIVSTEEEPGHPDHTHLHPPQPQGRPPVDGGGQAPRL
jgi:hypothetical protein